MRSRHDFLCVIRDGLRTAGCCNQIIRKDSTSDLGSGEIVVQGLHVEIWRDDWSGSQW